MNLKFNVGKFDTVITKIKQYLVYLKGLPIWAINLIVSALTATMTEVVSNTATANIVLPILKEMSLTLCYNPVYMGNVNNIKYTKR